MYTGGGGDIAINDTNYVTLASQSITFAAGDSVIVECDFLILNNSGAARTYTYALAIGGFLVETLDGATLAASATARSYAEFRGAAEVRTTSLAFSANRVNRMTPNVATTTAADVLLQNRKTWNTSASNLTGAQTVAVQIKSSASTATQTATVLAYRIQVV